MSKIFDNFVGDYISLTLKKDDKSNIQDSKGNIKVLQSPMIKEGFLFDEDDDYFFLTYDRNSEFLSLAVLKKEVVAIERKNPDHVDIELLTALDEAVGPEDAGIN